MRARDLAELVRLPAVLTAPGDSLAGAAAAGWPHGRRSWAMPVVSSCFYLAGMALNDYADRDLDARERPERPLPSGRIRPRTALAVAAGLTTAGVGIAGAAGGRTALRAAVPVAAAAWTYDLATKQTLAGPATMALARGCDVLLGAGGRRQALLPACAVAAHTLGVTWLSRGEVHGAAPRAGWAALATTTAAATSAALLPRSSRRARAAGIACAAGYAVTVGRAQARAAKHPDASTVRAATGVGVRGVIGLQAALVAGTGALGVAAALLSAGPLARAASEVVSPT
ncbi:4-hydroxybenzoate polyprenyltransferase [Saccharopolyspora rhizosphaerae]|uniref:4-hydroxybenzoate polyprenyltransferase n=1 Tax=Saccharopolyspora rhizosphaerae TaxID=2492662 RepID=A0A3R8P5L8_9PSEU|nr:UbiA family prenyltransferase [Saccharopolyspora rhizosphaerae]RRO17028.1 4-hydroxybenzoate polyprenyltransferase [Saccharopolyspora rhizosphaerae]